MKRGGLDNIKAASVWCPERCDKRLNDRESRGARGRERELKVKALGDRQWDEDTAAGEFCLDYSPPNCGVPEKVYKLPWQNGSWSSWIQCRKQSILCSPESYISFVCRTTSQIMPSHPECTQFLSKENSFFSSLPADSHACECRWVKPWGLSPVPLLASLASWVYGLAPRALRGTAFQRMSLSTKERKLDTHMKMERTCWLAYLVKPQFLG